MCAEPLPAAGPLQVVPGDYASKSTLPGVQAPLHPHFTDEGAEA